MLCYDWLNIIVCLIGWVLVCLSSISRKHASYMMMELAIVSGVYQV